MHASPFLATLLATAAALSSFAPARGNTAAPPVPIFSRAQLKYPLSRTDYYSRWVDRPLFLDPSLGDPAISSPSHLSKASFRKTAEAAVQTGLRGLGYFPARHLEQVLPALAAESDVAGFELLLDFGPNGSVEKMVADAGRALANPTSFRIDGKIVIVSYLTQQHPPEYWRGVMEKIRQAHGDRFIFLPAIITFAGTSANTWIARFDAGTITPAHEAAIKEELRQWARATDGLYTTNRPKTEDRLFHEAFYRDFIIRYFKEVLAEPEFAGKKHLGLSALMGHENCTRLGYTVSSEGSRTLRQSLEAALDARPSLIVIPEWDEQNENTSLRPTVYNGRSAMRIVRHYAAREQGQFQQPLPGDDTRLPNAILTYRKLLTLGEPLVLELLHIPEAGVSVDDRLTARVELLGEDGQVVYSGSSVPIKGGGLLEHTETIPSETFAAHRYLLPRLRFTSEGGERTFSDGFQPIDLRATWNWDYKWVMQPLRELLVPQASSFEVVHSKARPDSSAQRALRWVTQWFEREAPAPTHGPLTISATFRSEEPLAFVELLDNDDVVYSHTLAAPLPRETERSAVFRLDWQSLEWLNSARKLSGSLTLKNAKGEWTLPPGMKEEGERISFNGQLSSIWVERLYLTLPKDQVAQAVLEVDFPGIWKGEIPLRTVQEHGAYGFPGPLGLNFVVSRYLRQDRVPPLLNVNEVSFTVPLQPDLPRSRLNLQAISISGKIYRSRPLIHGTAQRDSRQVTLYSDAQKGAVTAEVDASLAPDIRYQFTPHQTGTILTTSAGRPFWGILGGFSTQATGRGGGESRDGTPFLRVSDYPGRITQSQSANYLQDGIGNQTETETRSAPTWEEIAPGEHALVFDGKGTFVTLPQGVIPRRSGFTVTMEVMPDHVNGEQLLIANASYYLGSLAVWMKDGALQARFVDFHAKETVLTPKLHLKAGEWNRVVISYDLKALTFEVNGHRSQPLPLPGPGCYDTVSVVGGFGKQWFSGKLRSLQIAHFPR